MASATCERESLVLDFSFKGRGDGVLFSSAPTALAFRLLLGLFVLKGSLFGSC